MRGTLIDVTAALDVLGIRILRGHGKEIRGVCPRHTDNGGPEGSVGDWYINATTGKSQCFSCGFRSSSVLTLASALTQQDLWSAVRLLRGVGAIDLSSFAPAEVEAPEQPLEAPEQLPVPQITAAHLALFDPPPRAVRKYRHITPEAIDAYGVRWSSEDKAWILPLYDAETGLFVGYQLRNKGTEKNQPDGLQKGRVLFGSQVVPDALPDERIVLVESPLDALRAWQAGFIGVATMGTQWTDEQAAVIQSWGREVIVAMDWDKAGEAAARRLWEQYRRRITLRFPAHRPEGVKDIGDMPNDLAIAETLGTLTTFPTSLTQH